MAVVEKLTPAQQLQMEQYRDKWMAIGNSTAPMDREKAQEAALFWYKEAGLSAPKIEFVPSLMAAVKVAGKEAVDAAIYCQHDAGGMGYASFMDEVLKVPIKSREHLDMWRQLVCSCGMIVTFSEVCYICDRPEAIHLNAQNVIHNEKGPAIRYRDGFEVYGLNGVRVPKTVVMTPPERMTTEWLQEYFLKQRNAEVRREIARKVGADLLCHRLGAKEVDRDGDYSLVVLELGDGRQRPYLKMKNPSVDTWHVEGVEPGIKTVAAALAWRNQTEEKPEVLS